MSKDDNMTERMIELYDTIEGLRAEVHRLKCINEIHKETIKDMHEFMRGERSGTQ